MKWKTVMEWANLLLFDFYVVHQTPYLFIKLVQVKKKLKKNKNTSSNYIYENKINRPEHLSDSDVNADISYFLDVNHFSQVCDNFHACGEFRTGLPSWKLRRDVLLQQDYVCLLDRKVFQWLITKCKTEPM